MAVTQTETAATIEDRSRIDGKAELIGGRIVRLIPTGRRPNRIALRIARSLDDHAEATGRGEAYTDNMGFAIPKLTSGRESFSPDASYYKGPFPSNEMRFVKGPPVFAVEVRSENDYDEAAEVERAAKRAASFEAGTLVVWDVDPKAGVIHAYTQPDPDHPPAVPGRPASRCRTGRTRLAHCRRSDLCMRCCSFSARSCLRSRSDHLL
ncbi:MAG: Uma2 family endonuclease [Isosphaeraceae bacterium]